MNHASLVVNRFAAVYFFRCTLLFNFENDIFHFIQNKILNIQIFKYTRMKYMNIFIRISKFKYLF